MSGNQVEWTGAANLWVDEIRAHDDYGHRLFAGHHDEAIRSDLAAYDGVSAPEPWRFYADDEPQWTEKDESVAYVNRFIREQTGKSGVVAFNRPQRDLLRHFVGTVEPSELLVDFYTFGLNVPRPDQSGYATGLQNALGSLVSLVWDRAGGGPGGGHTPVGGRAGPWLARRSAGPRHRRRSASRFTWRWPTA